MLQVRFSGSRLVNLYHTGKTALGFVSGRVIHKVAREEGEAFRTSFLLRWYGLVIQTIGLNLGFLFVCLFALLGNLDHLSFPIGSIEIMVYLKIVGRG